jgi:hypothetical protein
MKGRVYDAPSDDWTSGSTMRRMSFMKRPEGLEERSRRDALVEPLFNGLDGTQASEESSDPQGRGRLASVGPWLLLALACLVVWLLF